MRDNIQKRLERLDLANESEEVQSLVLEACRRNACLWLNDWVWTFDPRVNPAIVPFDLFPHQEKFVEWVAQREVLQEDGLVEKSRDSGMTWLCVAYAVHGFLFRKGFKAGFGSRKLDLVDKLGDLDSILEKARFIIDRLPWWMQPQDYSLGFCNLINRDNGTAIVGEGGDEIGRGGRNSIYFGDEHAYWEHAKKAEAALSQNTRCIIRVSTPNGTGNEFHTKRFSGGLPVFTFHWRDDPRKDDVWYEREKKRIGDPVIVAQELDIDYSASIAGICIPAKWVQAAIGFEKWLKDKHGIKMRSESAPIAGLDIAEEGKNRSVLGFRSGPVLTEVLDWGQKTTTWTAHEAIDQCVARQVQYLNYDAGGGFGGPLKHQAEVEETAEYNALEAQASVKPAERYRDPDKYYDAGGGFWLPLTEAMKAERAAALETQAAIVIDTQGKFIAYGLNGGGTCSAYTVWPNGKTSKEMFLNCRAEWWWNLRARFERCYEWREEGTEHNAEDCISIPQHAQLIAQLSLPLYERTETGKIQLESKKRMQARGIASPDFADMLSYLYATPPLVEEYAFF